MIELKILRNDTERVIAGLKKRNLSPEQLDLIQEIISLDDQRKLSQANMDQRFSQINQLSKEIGLAMKSNDSVSAEKNKLEVSRLKEENKEFEELLASSLLLIEEKLIQLPNIPHISVPEGKSADDNLVFKDWNSALPELPEDALPHWELAKKYKVFDMELGVKITGSGFILYRNNGAKLQRALINFFLDEASKSGYEEIQAPLMVNAESARATGQLPDKEAQMYYVEKDDLYLIPTAEVPVTNIYRDVILKESDFPILLTGYTPALGGKLDHMELM